MFWRNLSNKIAKLLNITCERYRDAIKHILAPCWETHRNIALLADTLIVGFSLIGFITGFNFIAMNMTTRYILEDYRGTEA